MRVVLNINGPRVLTVDAQGRDPDGKFAGGSGGGGGQHIQRHVPRENEGPAERADIARATMTHGKGTGKFSKADHKSTGEHHAQQAEKHEKRGDKIGAELHRKAAAAHQAAARSGNSEAAHAATKAANHHSDYGAGGRR